MKEYLIAGSYKMESGLDNDGLKAYHQKMLFDKVEQLAIASKGRLRVLNKLELIGIAVVEATESAVKVLKECGFTVNLNGKKKAL